MRVAQPEFGRQPSCAAVVSHGRCLSCQCVVHNREHCFRAAACSAVCMPQKAADFIRAVRCTCPRRRRCSVQWRSVRCACHSGQWPPRSGRSVQCACNEKATASLERPRRMMDVSRKATAFVQCQCSAVRNTEGNGRTVRWQCSAVRAVEGSGRTMQWQCSAARCVLRKAEAVPCSGCGRTLVLMALRWHATLGRGRRDRPAVRHCRRVSRDSGR